MLETLVDLEMIRLWIVPSKSLQYIQFKGLSRGKEITFAMDMRNSSAIAETRDEIYGNVHLVLL